MPRKLLIALAGVAALLVGAVGTAPAAFAATIPGAPTGLTATPGNTTVTLSWTAPSNTGGSAVTGYNVYQGTTSGSEDYSHAVNGGTLISATTFVVTGLTNAHTYYFTVEAVNAVGSSAASNEAWATPAATVPGAASSVSATPGDLSATVTWVAPTSPGGSNITSYTVKAADATAASRGGQSCTWTSGPLTCTVTGLTNGDSYTFTVTATNSLGTGASSNPSNAVVPAITAPSAPTGVTATPGNTTITLSWTAPSDGGSAITGYDVYESTTSGAENYASPVNTSPITGTTTTLTGLTNGTTYYFTVKAINAVGSSAPSAEVWAIPAGTVPGAPTAVSAVAGYGSATVSWSAPANVGGSAISRYSVTATDTTLASRGGQTCTTSGALSCTVTGLTNGDLYSFTVTATNSVGTSVASGSSNVVVPTITAPLAPTRLTATPSDHRVVLSWTAPANGGASILGYNVFEATSAGGENYASPVNGAVLVSGTTATISSLTNGDTYYFTVEAVNAVGSSPSSNEAWAIPAATTADSPQDVTATIGPDGTAVVSWTAPLDSGGSSITGYVVTPYIGATAQPAKVFDNNTATTETITGLVPGDSYSFMVAAVNASGTGSESAASSVVTLPRAATSLALSMAAAKVTFGHEQSEVFSVTVSPAYSGPVPTGTVLVKKSTTTLCTITLSAAKGSCSLTASELPARTFSVYASYARTANFYGSLATKSLTVMKASTKTTLKLSSAKVTLGQEQLERLTVTVSPEYPGTAPAGPVTITGLACHMTLSSGKGTCTLSSKKFPVGAKKLVAHYWGGGSYLASLSASTTLTVVK